MAIRVSCPSCSSETSVDDARAGTDILCPQCKQRLTVPSLSADPPEARAVRTWKDDSGVDSGERTALPRYRGDDYDVPSQRDLSRWSATLTGLGMMFWSGVVMAVLLAVIAVAGLALGNNPQLFMMGGGAGPPPPEMMAAGLLFGAAGCTLLVLMIVTFVGMCMCCSVPPESGAKGRAIAAVVMVVVAVVGVVAFSVAAAVAGFNQIRQMGVAPPGQMPFGSGFVIGIMVVGSLANLLIVTLWLLFHKAVADHLRNGRLARVSVLCIFLFAVYQVGSQALQFAANPALVEGNLLAVPPNPAWMMITQAWGLIWVVGLSIMFLYILRETRRTILEDQGALDSGREDSGREDWRER